MFHGFALLDRRIRIIQKQTGGTQFEGLCYALTEWFGPPVAE